MINLTNIPAIQRKARGVKITVALPETMGVAKMTERQADARLSNALNISVERSCKLEASSDKIG